MIWTVLRVMGLALWRDRGALVLAFGLPPLLFLVFAEVFSGAGDEDFTLRVGLLDRHQSALTRQISARLAAQPGLEITIEPDSSIDALEQTVRAGLIDAAIVIRGQPGRESGTGAPILIIGDASRALAAAVLGGRVQRLLVTEFPALEARRAIALTETLIGDWTAQQSGRLAGALDELERAAPESDSPARSASGDLDQRLLGGGRAIDPGVSYYAGAIAILFLLFSAFQGAISLIEERNSGIVDRLCTGPGGIDVLVFGKGLYLTLQGLIQAALIFSVAWVVYGLDWAARFGSWLVTALLAAAAAAWLGMLLAAACRSRQQAQTASAFAVLILSAAGGSMMPRFLMPGWLRELGWLTPNAWAIESWQGAFWRGESPAQLAPGWAALAGFALVSMVLTIVLARRRLGKG